MQPAQQRPRILIPIPTSFDEPYNAQSWPEYAAAVRNAGGEPVRVALTHSFAELQSIITDANGVLLPGSGADIDPARYGHIADEASAQPDALREATDRALLEAAEHLRLPLLGICFGMQSMNVFHGGTLIQDVEPVPVNHRAGRAVKAAHTAVVTLHSRLAVSMQGAEDLALAVDSARIPVNSSHHQAVGIAGEALRVVARCPDDSVIEAVENGDADRWLVGVQWHPERTYDVSETSRLLFRAFVTAASAVPERQATDTAAMHR